jgi:uncharacterized protein YbjT (DUF2867 family)
MKILLTGASGFIGGALSRALKCQGHTLVPVSRRHGVDFSRMQAAADWRPLLAGVDAVVNAVGIIAEGGGQRFDVLHRHAPQALFNACQQAGVHKVIQISALGADERAVTAYHLSKRAADDALRRLPLDSYVLRPSLVYGQGGASSGLFLQLARLPLVPLVGSGEQQVQPVHISDLVATVLRCLAYGGGPLTLDVVGPEVFSFAQWLQQMRSSQGLGPARFVRIPTELVLAACQVGRFFSPLLQPDNLRMLQMGSTAEVKPLQEFLGRSPIGVAPNLFTSNEGALHEL